jgi:hypothetical protein
MFKILLLTPDIDDKLQLIASDNDILSVALLARDGEYNQYILVQYGAKIPADPSSVLKAKKQ